MYRKNLNKVKKLNRQINFYPAKSLKTKNLMIKKLIDLKKHQKAIQKRIKI